jgi:hypothetical protein
MEKAFELGIHVPKRFEGGATSPALHRVALALGKKHEPANHASICAWRSIAPVSLHRRDRTRAAHELMAMPARWRLDHDVYALPFEIWLNTAARKVFRPLKPKVDASQLADKAVTC